MKHTSLKYLEIDFIIFDPFHYDIQLNRNSKSKISNSLLFVWYVLRYIQPYKIQTIKYKHWSDLADVHQLVFLTSPPNNCQSAKIELVMWNKQIARAEKRNLETCCGCPSLSASSFWFCIYIRLFFNYGNVCPPAEQPNFFSKFPVGCRRASWRKRRRWEVFRRRSE